MIPIKLATGRAKDMGQGQTNMVEQWVSKVLNYSSQYNNSSWSASSVIGAPKVYPKYGDKQGTWAQGKKDANQFIEVEFPEKVLIARIDIYETYHCGGVKKILAKQPNGTWYTVWETPRVTDINSSRIFSPNFQSLTFESNQLRINIDCTVSKSWVEIDAIKIYGSRGSYPASQHMSARSNPVNNTTHTEQWVSRVIDYSSQYDDYSWPASAVIGEPQVYPDYGDHPGAWAQGTTDQYQFIQVEFPEKVYITKVDIYETFNAGGVKRILAQHLNGNWYTVWETADVSHIESSNIFSPNFPSLTFESNVLKIEVDCSESGSWVEIDAIKLHGNKRAVPKTQQTKQSANRPLPANNPNYVEQWVSKVINFSSQYNSTSWSASSVEGVPKVYPKYGDIAGAWAMKSIDSNQFLELEYAEKIFIEKIDIYETYHAGGVKRIRAKRPDGSWFTVWETPRVFTQKSSRIFSPEFQKLPFQCNILRIDVDCTACNTWVEIDAVKIIGTKFNFDLPPADTDITLDLVKLVNNPLFSDIRFDVNGVMFYGHKAILSVRSDYFNAMFNFDAANSRQVPTAPSFQPSAPPLQGAMPAPVLPPKSHLYPPSYDAVMSGGHQMPSNVPPEAVYQPTLQTNTVPLKDINPGAFAVVLHYVYTKKLPPTCSSQLLPTVWRTADRFALEGLKSLTIMEIRSKLTIDNVVDVYVDVISTLPVIDGLQQMCEMFMQDNMKEIVRQKSFRSLPKDITVDLIQMMTQNLHIR